MLPKDTPIPIGLCQCGCGRSVPVATRTRPYLGTTAGQPVSFVQGHQWRGKAPKRPKTCQRCNQKLGTEHFDTSSHSGTLYPYCRKCRTEVGADASPVEPVIEEGFGHWLAGFIDGEGSFGIRFCKGSYLCTFYLGLRDDDRAIVEEMHKVCGIGTVKDRRHGKWNPQVTWDVRSKRDCVALVRILDRFPLRAKKRRDYLIWRSAVLLWGSSNRFPDQGALAKFRTELIEGRRYISDSG